MPNPKLELLPRELIASIACHVDALSVLRLSATCKAIRKAAYDGLVFKDVLVRSQNTNWKCDDLDISAVSSKSGNDTAIWARYAVADQRAFELTVHIPEREHPPQAYIHFLPELGVVKHPATSPWKFKSCGLPAFFKDVDPDLKKCQLFTMNLACLASPTYGMDPTKTNILANRCHHLAALPILKIALEKTLTTRNRIWPYNSSARVPYIPSPKISQLPFNPLNDTYNLPIPFSRSGLDILGGSNTSFSAWDSWYNQHTRALFQQFSKMTSGSWQGYYAAYADRYGLLDPPMLNITFTTLSTETDPVTNSISSLKVRADDGYDGHGSFWIEGSFSYTDDREVKFQARKHYRSMPVSWWWDLRLTPFGLLGYWGQWVERIRGNPDAGMRFIKNGSVWLWRSEWTTTETEERNADEHVLASPTGVGGDENVDDEFWEHD